MPTEPLPLRTLREAQHWSQAELAAKAGVSEQTIWQIERSGTEHRRRPHPSNRRAIAAALGVEPGAIAEFVRELRDDPGTPDGG
jgi:transcriptional regulator with XRE-family HTH domain